METLNKVLDDYIDYILNIKHEYLRKIKKHTFIPNLQFENHQNAKYKYGMFSLKVFFTNYAES